MGENFVCLDEESHRLHDFIHQWSREPLTGEDVRDIEFPVENLAKLKFDPGSSPLGKLICQEINEKFIPTFHELVRLPFLDEITEPLVTEYSQNRVEQICLNVPSWGDRFSTKLILFFYRRFTKHAHQTPAHMRIIYALATAVELVTSATILIDDMMDGALQRYGGGAWHIQNPLTVVADFDALKEMGRMIVRHCVPDRLPTKKQICRLLDEYCRRNAYYWCFSTYLENQRQTATRRCRFPFERIGENTVLSRNYNRGFQYVWFLAEISRLASCHMGIPSDSLHTFREQIFRVADLTCYVNDLQGMVHPSKPVDTIPESELMDIMSGEVHNYYLLAALEIAREDGQEANAAKRQDILDVLQRCYGTRQLKDAQEVIEVYRRYGISKRVSLKVHHAFTLYQQAKEKGIALVNAPPDIALFAMSCMFAGDKSELGKDIRQLDEHEALTAEQKEIWLQQRVCSIF